MNEMDKKVKERQMPNTDGDMTNTTDNLTSDDMMARPNQTNGYTANDAEQEFTDADELLDRDRTTKTTDNQMNM